MSPGDRCAPGSRPARTSGVVPRAVNREQVVEAADRVARREGLVQCTIRQLCTELGVTPPAIYTHFPAKDLIVEELIDRVLQRVLIDELPQAPWRELLRSYFVELYEEVLPYNGMAHYLATRLIIGWSFAPWLSEQISEAQLDVNVFSTIIYALAANSVGHLVVSESLGRSGVTPINGAEEMRELYVRSLDLLLDGFERDFSNVERRTEGTRNPRLSSRKSSSSPKRNTTRHR